MIELAENRYGKSRVRLMKVTRHPHGNELREWTVQVLLKGDFHSAHAEGDNSKILATDTMKNTVYSIARNSTATSMEAYAMELADFLLGRNPQVSSAAIRIESAMWKRMTVDGKPHPTTFMHGSGETETTHVERAQAGTFRILSGLDNLVILKTANSGFEGYIKESLTTLKETSDRIFGTAVRAEWHYTKTNIDFDAVRTSVRETMLGIFADHDSKSVQQTLYAMAKSALEAVPEIDEMELAMPNKHCLLVDLSRFGQDNPNEIFVPTDEPHGYIEARVRRTPDAE
ncbi:factor-independent urate hydroxylase [Granulicella arctica]|uniref:Uricase n=1 Tax=Granulicella arctica TaxID=940613 RepID=A0A7Y9PGH5_9BACT|nr:urate oxidase [Granulicella arctica]NYF79412.1 urate oxidase [Granulicella arctica]